eukprot:gene10910-12715_t
MFMKYHPKFRGLVSIVAHSLGSVICWDILSKKHVTFKVENVYAIGSPLGIFLRLNGNEMGKMDITKVIPQCSNWFNIFSPTDPVAYRIEPFLDERYIEMKPCLIELLDSDSKKTMFDNYKDKLFGGFFKGKTGATTTSTTTTTTTTVSLPAQPTSAAAVKAVIDKVQQMDCDEAGQVLVPEESQDVPPESPKTRMEITKTTTEEKIEVTQDAMEEEEEELIDAETTTPSMMESAINSTLERVKAHPLEISPNSSGDSIKGYSSLTGSGSPMRLSSSPANGNGPTPLNGSTGVTNGNGSELKRYDYVLEEGSTLWRNGLPSYLLSIFSHISYWDSKGMAKFLLNTLTFKFTKMSEMQKQRKRELSKGLGNLLPQSNDSLVEKTPSVPERINNVKNGVKDSVVSPVFLSTKIYN